jgi:hypothetical protein
VYKNKTPPKLQHEITFNRSEYCYAVIFVKKCTLKYIKSATTDTIHIKYRSIIKTARIQRQILYNAIKINITQTIKSIKLKLNENLIVNI